MVPLGARGEHDDGAPAGAAVPFVILQGSLGGHVDAGTLALDADAADPQRKRAGLVPTPGDLAGPTEAGAAAFVTGDLKPAPVSYTHLRAHETPEHLVCRL